MRGFAERVRAGTRAWAERRPLPGGAVLLTARTVRAVARTRIIGLAAESAFFSLLSLPALLLGLVGTLGHLRGVFGERTVLEIRTWMLDLAAQALTEHTVDTLVAPLVDDFLRGAQGGVLSVTFLVSLWSGSRAMNVFIEAITIAYGLDGLRGYFARRALAFVAYLGALVFALAVLPVMVVGPDMVHRLLPATVGHLNNLYWPVVGGLTVLAVAMLYALSVPARVAFWRYLPGAALAALILLLGSVVLRLYLDASLGQVTIYGSLAAPIAVLAWLWVMALAVLIGTSLNAEIDLMWPTQRTAAARAELAARRVASAAQQVERHEQAMQTAAERDERRDERRGEQAEAVKTGTKRLWNGVRLQVNERLARVVRQGESVRLSDHGSGGGHEDGGDHGAGRGGGEDAGEDGGPGARGATPEDAPEDGRETGPEDGTEGGPGEGSASPAGTVGSESPEHPSGPGAAHPGASGPGESGGGEGPGTPGPRPPSDRAESPPRS
ncbi:YihY/virulence factor BrkB family protein [Nocardiopsis sp. RSe5-2]|uniref:YihY/virulence factor BrkB family protein n=1 Tax=Nocardiopsis endophytica TaxID=3018445 RepID=A0ABT4UB11_9ACTN|nr:YihY/virulence factor BrkB family protein [Nocardiopsis endophytica]MDA2814103.1 YihY/virulence factor BrkB family protein [Nocardiopsis endophytica]